MRDRRPRLVAVRRGGGDDRRWFVVLIRADHTADFIEAYRWRWQRERAARRLVKRLAHAQWADSLIA
jgi:hypothetical protein